MKSRGAAGEMSIIVDGACSNEWREIRNDSRLKGEREGESRGGGEGEK